jgi:hypothetical protein
LLAHFIYKNFHYQDYNHAFRWGIYSYCLLQNITESGL